MKKIKLSLIIFLLLLPHLSAQNSDFKILIKGGISEYGGVNGIIISGSSGADAWYSGPIIGGGFEYSLSNNWFLQSTFEYSYNTYGALVAVSESMERGENTVVDIMGNIKKRWNWFYIIGGAGFSFQKSTDSFITGFYEEEFYRRNVYRGSSNVVLTGLMGVGIEFYPVENIAIFLEGSWRLRVYVTPVAQLGVGFKL